MRWVGIIPSIWPEYTRDCLASMHPDFEQHVIVVDNTVRNHGVAGSWNVGARIVRDRKLDFLVCISAAVRFGEPGGLDFVEEFPRYPEAWSMEADKGLGWHLIAFPRRTIERVGIFDENFWPAYGDDLDYSWRITIASQEDGRELLWPKVPVDARLESVAHGINLAHAHVEFVQIEEYLARKWGGHKDTWHEKGWRRPFNEPDTPLSWWPVPADPRCHIPFDRPPDLPWGLP